MNPGWTEDRVGALKKLWLEGQSASQIAKALGGGVTRNAVIGKVHRLGLSGRAAPSQPARTTFRPARPRAAAPAAPVQAPSAPRRLEAAAPRPVVAAPAPQAPSPAPELPGTATVLTLGAHMCKWPIGDPSTRDFSFCGRRASEGVYCVEHARVAYQPQVRKGAKDGASELARSLRRYI
ncbi:GcrA cell cycle regulator [Brevundimonas naejangsanensis]|uniref:GcrA cell cycle regulator n=1 Tax=Brevundimonas naejangsanensis TaxID=588932 RepID=A0A494RE53_9CAUL|nr:GcrA family cell cycle regulator [Brevundimonas naejangsanensis]AYG94451.1 GcrA cell cycle regulator [Brevundimonas naejangsanensis]